MRRDVIHSLQAPHPIGPYSQAIATEQLVFLSGQIGLDPATTALVTGGPEVEAEQVMKNLGAVLEAAGVTFAEVVRCTIYLTDMGDFAKVNEVYGRYFPQKPPARATVQVAGLPKGARVEIDAIAVRV